MRSELSRTPVSDQGFTLIELLMVVAIIGVLAAISIHHLFQAKLAANESSAIGTLRVINSAQAAYSSSCGRNAFALTTVVLANGRYLSEDAALASKSGYLFAMTAGGGGTAPNADCNGLAAQTSYYASADPISSGSGRRGFATNPAATIWEDVDGTAPPEPFVLSATVRPVGRN